MSYVLRRLRGISGFVLVILLVEWLDELIDSGFGVLLPSIRADLNLSYFQIGLLFAIPNITSFFIEPIIGVMGDTARRRSLVIGGGVCFALSYIAIAASEAFAPILLGLMVLYSSNGAFVNLLQATLMDSNPARHEQNMARWTFFGYAGSLLGPVVVGVSAALGLDWRMVFLLYAALTLTLVGLVWRYRAQIVPGQPNGDDDEPTEGWRGLWTALKRPGVLRWMILLEFSDLLLDVLFAYLALYFVDVVGATIAEAGVAALVLTASGFAGSLLVIPLLERVRGVVYLRFSAAISSVLYPLFLLSPSLPVKLIALAVIGAVNSGWYSVLQAGLYSALPGRSGAVTAIGSVTATMTAVFPFALGAIAEIAGLNTAMWVLWSGALVLLVAAPRR